ncbi:MAG: hypothetical protein HGB11_02025 [Chlorobiales bacterium]|nr:hypothetical protein [Chlorobiales bacterium]
MFKTIIPSFFAAVILLAFLLHGCKDDGPVSPSPETKGKISLGFSLKPAATMGVNVPALVSPSQKDRFLIVWI